MFVVGLVGLFVRQLFKLILALIGTEGSSGEDGSPIFGAALGIILGALGIWFAVRNIRRGKKPSAIICGSTALIVAIGALSVWMPYHREQQVTQKVESWGGRVYTETGGPYWLRWLVGTDRMRAFKVFDRVSTVYMSRAQITEVEIAYLNRLANLRGLSLTGNASTDSSLLHLHELTNLESLSLEGITVTDDGLTHLTRMTNLKVLCLDHTGISGLGLGQLPSNLRVQIIGSIDY
jgi:hypothetical protein